MERRFLEVGSLLRARGPMPRHCQRHAGGGVIAHSLKLMDLIITSHVIYIYRYYNYQL